MPRIVTYAPLLIALAVALALALLFAPRVHAQEWRRGAPMHQYYPPERFQHRQFERHEWHERRFVGPQMWIVPPQMYYQPPVYYRQWGYGRCWSPEPNPYWDGRGWVNGHYHPC